MSNELSIALVAIARPTFDVPLAQTVAATAVAQLQSTGCRQLGTGADLIMDAAGAARALAVLQAADFDLLILLSASFADSSMAVELAQVAAARRVPVLLWAVPEARTGGRLRLNSLCGINLAGHALALRNINYDYLLTHVDDGGALDKIKLLARVGHAQRVLGKATIGVVGQHPVGFDTCRYADEDLQRLFGVQVKPLELSATLAAAAAVGAEPRHTFLTRVAAFTPNLGELDAAATAGTAGVYTALRTAVDQAGLAGVAVRCWPEFFTELGCAACGAMSVLNEEGCPASCEADVNGTLTSLLLQTLSGSHAFITDLVSIDADSDTGVFWHCGLAPVSMADPAVGVRGAIHSNRKLPLLFEFPLRPGRVTIARLHRSNLTAGSAGYQLVVGGGAMVQAPRSFGGTCGTVRFDLPATQVFDRVMRAGLEHHFSITYGDVREELRIFARMAGLSILELTNS